MTEKKNKIITMRVSEKMKAKIKDRADNADMTVTDYLTVCGLDKKIVKVDGLDALLSELKAQGRNLNQLTTLANMGRIDFVRGDELIDLYGELMRTLRTILEAVQ